MDFQLTEEQRAIQKTARNFVAERLAPQAARWDKEKIFPEAVLREAAALGFGGLYCKEDVGGSALTRLDAALVFEELARANKPAVPQDNSGTAMTELRYMPSDHPGGPVA